MSRPHLPAPPTPTYDLAAIPRSLRLLITVGVIGLPLTGVLALLTDWFTTTQLVRLWLQCAATIIGGGLLLAAGSLRSLAWLRRLILLCGGVLLVLAVLDSLDGQQDWLPTGVVLLSAWALQYADTCVQLLAAARPQSRRRWLAIGLSALASLGYVGVAGSYVVMHRTITPVQLDQHPLFAAGIVIATLVNWLGEMGRFTPQLSGIVQVCPACGLPNIAERTRCKRCRAPLGATDAAVDNHLPI